MSKRFDTKQLFAALLAIAFVLTVLLPMFAASASAEVLKGGVKEENLRLAPSGRPQSGGADLRIHRVPRALEGSAVDANSFAQPLAANSDPLSGVVDDNAFAQPPKGFDIGAERNSKEMMLAWERWHKQLSEAIYTRWQRIARDAGKATLRITITRDRRITAQVLNCHGGPEFQDTILEAVASLEGNPGLTFPAKSQRQHVSFEADYIAASHVKPGFSWVKNDYERVRQDY
jgi:hypothetical protein